MPAKSQEALARKRQQMNAAKRTKAAKHRGDSAPPIVPSPNRKWHLGPPQRPMSKAELRADFELAMRNTARLTDTGREA